MKKRIVCIFLSTIIICCTGYATTIGIACVHNIEAPKNAKKITTLIEAEIFELCFNNGIIVTSLDYSLMHGIKQYKNNEALTAAFDSPVDYLIAVYCDYGKDSASESLANYSINWKHICWKIITVSSNKILFEEEIGLQKIAESDLIQKAKQIGQCIGENILKKI